MKESMAFQLLSISPPDDFCQGIPVFKKNVDRCSKLYDFIGPETWFIFECLRMDKHWLYNKPEQCTANESFKKGKKFVAIFRLCCHFNRK